MQFHQEHAKVPSQSGLADALLTLEGYAGQAEPTPVWLRLGPLPGGEGVALDLGDDDGNVAVVRPGRWEVETQSPVLFRRTEATAAFSLPESGGDLADLRRLLNVDDDGWDLLVGFLVASFIPDIPHPVLLLVGEQGTGKSEATVIVVNLIDPSAAPKRSTPRDQRDWIVAASASWVVPLDNVSYLGEWLSDAICRAATGEGSVTRKLYTDDDISVLSFRRVVLLNGISVGSLRGDLGSRLLPIELRPIPGDQRRREQPLRAEYERLRPGIFGALLDALAAVLAELPQVEPPDLPRMADFARVLHALDRLGVTRDSVGAYARAREDIDSQVLEGDPVAQAVLLFAESKRKPGGWKGTAAQLLAEIGPGPAGLRNWPGSASALSARLTRAAPAMRREGLDVRTGRDRGGRWTALQWIQPGQLGGDDQ